MTADRPAAFSVSVVVPSYLRSDLLRRCLEGLAAQTRPPDQVVVARRHDDEATRSVVTAADPPVLEAVVNEPGVLAALVRGVAVSRGDVVAFTDDDAVPRPGWLEGIVAHFQDPTVGGVGGRDIVHGIPDAPCGPDVDVGRITRWGKLIGNHHLASGCSRDVTVLKGVNMAFRRVALALPQSLRGSGAQVHFEVATGLWARQRGWRLIFDPAVVVDHYPGPRFDQDRRQRPAPQATRDAAYNLVACLLTLEPELLWRRATFGLVVGDAMTPGLARACLAAVQRDWPVLQRSAPSLSGQLSALRDVVLRRRVVMLPADQP